MLTINFKNYQGAKKLNFPACPLSKLWPGCKGKVCVRNKWPIQPELIPVSEALSD